MSAARRSRFFFVPMKKWLLSLLIILLMILGFIWYRANSSYRFSICAIFKDEAPWLKEWIEYHRLLGASHFYLYNNDSTDRYLEVLQPYIKKGIVELIEWSSSDPKRAIYGIDDSAPWQAFQIGAYRDCVRKRAYGKAKWVACIDIDEFIVPTQGVRSFTQLLKQKEAEGVGSLQLNWRVFGTSHVLKMEENELLIEKLTKRAPDDFEWHRLTKSIHRPEAVKLPIIHIAQKMRKKFKREEVDPQLFRIHHYWTRTEKELAQKRRVPPFSMDHLNEVDDVSIIPLARELKKILPQPKDRAPSAAAGCF